MVRQSEDGKVERLMAAKNIVAKRLIHFLSRQPLDPIRGIDTLIWRAQADWRWTRQMVGRGIQSVSSAKGRSGGDRRQSGRLVFNER